MLSDPDIAKVQTCAPFTHDFVHVFFYIYIYRAVALIVNLDSPLHP